MAFGFLFNDDIFISYSRVDDGDYVVRLDNERAEPRTNAAADN